MNAVQETAERLEERLPAFLPDPMLSAYLAALALLYKRPEESLRHDERGSGLRRFLDPTRTPDWALPWLSQLVGSPQLAGLTTAQIRTVVRDAPTLKRGGLPAMVAAARMHMPPGAVVRIIERDGGAYQITLQTHPSQTPDPALVEAAVRAAKPTGLVLTYTLYDGLMVGVFESMAYDGTAPEWMTLADFEDDFTDIDDFETYTS